jgi:hypothetical protein
VRRTFTTLTVLLAVTVGMSACGDNVKVNFDKNGKEKACTALSSVKAEVGEFTDGSTTTTAGDAQTKLTDINQKLTAATDTNTGFTKSILEPVTTALTTANDKLEGVDPSTPLSDVPGATDLQKNVQTAFNNLNSMFKCS